MTKFQRIRAVSAALLLAAAGSLYGAQPVGAQRVSLQDVLNQLNDLTARVEALEGQAPPVPEFDIVVALDGTGDFTDPITAVESVVDASAGRLYVVKIMPGTYDLGPDSLQMKPYVDIEGSGRTATRIVGNASGSSTGVVLGVSNAELRMLTVEHTGDAFSTGIAIYNVNASPTITDVQAIAHDSPVANAIRNEFAAPLITNVTAIASSDTFARGIYNTDSTVTLIDVVAETSSTSATNAAPAILNQDTDATMTNIVATTRGAGGAVQNTDSIVAMAQVTAVLRGCGQGVSNVRSIVTMSEITASAALGSFTCSSSAANVGVRNSQSGPVEMTNVTASASGAAFNHGVATESGSFSVTMSNVTASASGGDAANFAVLNRASTGITMADVTATAGGGAAAVGVEVEQSAQVVMTNVTSTASTATSQSVGIRGFTGGNVVNIKDSLISGADYSLLPGGSFFVENSRLDGPVPGIGSIVCINVTDLLGNPLGPDCQP